MTTSPNQSAYPLAIRRNAQQEVLRVLIVEDSPINARLAQHMFRWSGGDVRTVATGPDAVTTFERQPFHLVVLDCHLPGFDGFTAARKMRAVESLQAARTRACIVGLTAYAGDDCHERCLRAGMDACFQKPLHLDMLDAMLRLCEGYDVFSSTLPASA